MTIFVGETLTLVGSAVNPLVDLSSDDYVITDAVGQVECYAPPKNPAKVPNDRTADKGPFPMAFVADILNKDGSLGAYVAYVETDNTWPPGKWAFKVTLTNSYATWEYGSFQLVE